MFNPADILVDSKPIPGGFIDEKFRQYSKLPILKRFNEIVREVVHQVLIHYRKEVSGQERRKLHADIRKMFPSTNR